MDSGENTFANSRGWAAVAGAVSVAVVVQDKNSRGNGGSNNLLLPKQISHIRGYRIIDLNYPILAEIVTSIDRWNAQINVLDFLIDFMIQQAKNLDKEIMKAYGTTNFEEAGPRESNCINSEATKLLDILQQHWTCINTICHEAHIYKEQYNSAKLGGYSPSRSYYRLGRARRPGVQVPNQ